MTCVGNPRTDIQTMSEPQLEILDRKSVTYGKVWRLIPLIPAWERQRQRQAGLCNCETSQRDTVVSKNPNNNNNLLLYVKKIKSSLNHRVRGTTQTTDRTYDVNTNENDPI